MIKKLYTLMLSTLLLMAAVAQAQDAAPATQPSLLKNGDFSVDSNGDGIPDEWTTKAADGVSWVKEDDKIILKLVSAEEGKNYMLYHRMNLEKDHPKVLEMKVKVRYADVKPGKSAWFDARIMMNWKDSAGKNLKPQPPAPAFKGTSKGWVEKSVHFKVPDGASYLEIMPTLFQAASGTFEIASIQVFPSTEDKLPPPPAMVPSQPVSLYMGDKTPPPLKVVGNQLQDPSGKHVWLQGVSIDSLQWAATGEKIDKSVPVAIDEWKSNVVRLPVVEEFWFGWGKWQGKDKDGFKYRAIVDQAVNDCASRGAYIVIDLHRFGAPNEKHYAFWKDAATRYKNHPAVLFEIFNEPHSLSWKVWRDGGNVKEGAEDKGVVENTEAIEKNTTPGFQKMVDDIRATGANNIIIAGGLDWSYNLQGILKGFALKDSEAGNGIVYSSHVYPWKKDWQKNFLDIAEKYPLFIGETGNPESWDNFKFIKDSERYDPVGIGSPWPNDMIAVIQKHKLNWTAFSFHPKCAPAMLTGWDYTPNEWWGAYVKKALAGEQFELKKLR
jgi:endoglucanase